MTHPAPSPHHPGFMVLHGNRLEDLRDLLTQFLKAQPLAPLEAEHILVQSNGMKHWLEMALADDAALGICAATHMLLPGRFLWQIYRQVLGAQQVAPRMPLDKRTLVWRLLRLLPGLARSNAVYAPLQGYLGDGTDTRKRYQLALQLADVFDAYQTYRGDWLDPWRRGQTVAGAGAPEAGQAWQAQLWRDLCADLGADLRAESRATTPAPDASRADVHRRFMQALQAAPARPDAARPFGLPPRIVVFGISALPLQTVEALAALGRFAQVLMLVQNPCRYHWADSVPGHALLPPQMGQQRRPRLPAAASERASGNPLLAAWGRQGRDYLHALDLFDNVDSYRARLQRVDVFVDPAAVPQPTQLAQLQSSILQLAPAPAPPVALNAHDDSITLVSCHSPQRELEVLHDQLWAWFDADPTLRARDVMVMVPDMARFAPHIQAVFGRFAPGQARHIPFSLADRQAQPSPLVQALERLLALPQARVTLSEGLDLLGVDAVRQRFELSSADLAQLQRWLTQAGVRWGLDAHHREAWGLDAERAGCDQNTWAFGLRRLLLGYAVGEAPPWAGVAPQAGLQGLDNALMGRLLQWLDAVTQTVSELASAQTPAQWVQTLTRLVARFFAASDAAQERAIQGLLAPLQAWQTDCAEARLDEAVPLQVLREHWLAQLQEGGLHQRFFGGGVQFGTLMPMRAIPFPVIALLGLNDGDYPRAALARDFDLMTQDWRAGDRARRDDDRYLFLEALLSARQKLYLSWQGQRATDNAEQPPSVLVAQLMAFLQQGWTPARTPRQHPLQAFAPAYFLHGSGLQTYDQDWAQLHLQPPLQTHPLASHPFAKADAASVSTPVSAPGHGARADEPARAAAPPALTLDALQRLLRQPVEVFFRDRLGLRLAPPAPPHPDEEPFALDPLTRHQLGQALLQAQDPEAALQALPLSGQLPLAAFGQRETGVLRQQLGVLQQRLAPWLAAGALPLPPRAIALTLAGVHLSGSLNGLRQVPGTDSALQLHQRLGKVAQGTGKDRHARGHLMARLWVEHLAACASGQPLHSVLLGLDGQLQCAPLAPAEACAVLERLVRAYQAAWLRPLPVACKTAWAYLHTQQRKDAQGLDTDPHDAAEEVFQGTPLKAGERAESADLGRAFDDYDEIEDELPHWAEQIYGDLARHLQLAPEAAP